MSRRVLLLGAGGQLGRRVGEIFTARQWHIIGADVSGAASKAQVSKFIPLDTSLSPEDQGRSLVAALQTTLGEQKLDAIVNIAGGFAMGSASDADVIRNTRAMVESSVYSSVLAAHAASVALRPKGLLVLPGAFAALSATPWSLPYGAAKAAVHHLVRSLSHPNSVGLPYGVKTIGLAPQTLDTPQNRDAMPDADRSSWASLDEVAQQLEAWCTNPDSVESGKIYVIHKAGGLPATFTPLNPL